MISVERDDRPRRRLLLLWATLLSILIHASLIPLAAWMSLLNTIWGPPAAPREIVVSSTAVRIERRPVPRPRAVQPLLPTPPHVTREATHAYATQPAAPPVPRHELARERPQTETQPAPQRTPPTQAPMLQQQIEQQERAFAQEIAQLRARNNPLSLATHAPEVPAAYHRTYFDVPGRRVDENAMQVQVIPIRHWYTASSICYYTRYVAQYTHGGSEEGTIPWPVCYPVGDDRIAHPPFVHDIPVPVPPPGYVLPPGTYLTPLLARIYATRRAVQ